MSGTSSGRTSSRGIGSGRLGGWATFGRYLLFQLPGWFVAAVVLGLCVRFWGLQQGLAWVLFGLWLVKDFVLYPLVRAAYQVRTARPGEDLVGALGVAREALDPEGYVRVGPELWRAALAERSAPVPEGAAVRVVDVEGLTLRVTGEGEGPGAQAA